MQPGMRPTGVHTDPVGVYHYQPALPTSRKVSHTKLSTV